jgi:hypothetical protein
MTANDEELYKLLSVYAKQVIKNVELFNEIYNSTDKKLLLKLVAQYEAGKELVHGYNKRVTELLELRNSNLS